MRMYGLIGYPLGHSFSMTYFEQKFRKENIVDTVYRNFPISTIRKFPDLVEEYPELCGLNVTIPYKQEVIPYLHQLDETAAEIGAVNTISLVRSGNNLLMKGYNTDVTGFTDSLNMLMKTRPDAALVLGTGGSSKAVIYSLGKMGIEVHRVSRRSSGNAMAYNELDRKVIDKCKLIVNTTPLGMFPEVDTCPDIPYEFIGREHIVFDLVYNPEMTLFMKKSSEKGALACNGMDMLVGQAEAAWKIWNSQK